MSLSTSSLKAPFRAARRLPWGGALLAVAAAGMLALPAPVAAQFTTGVAPPERRSAPAPEEVIASHRARQDTVAIQERLDLRAWVDSAALAIERGESPAAPIPTQPGDTLGPVERTPVTADTAAPVRPTRPADQLPRATTVFREGAPAPATATPFPMLMLAGAGLLVGGALLRIRR